VEIETGGCMMGKVKEGEEIIATQLGRINAFSEKEIFLFCDKEGTKITVNFANFDFVNKYRNVNP